MIVMMDTNKLDIAETEIGCKVEQLLTPLTRFKRQRVSENFCIDNGAFSKFNAIGFLSLLEREESAIDLCRWVAVPDVVGSAIRTLEVFDRWKYKIQQWPLALVCQDGQENHPIPWEDIVAVFIGGSTDWKMSNSAAAIIKAAKALGKWAHAGRVNTVARFEYFEELGADSIDGSGLAQYSHMRKAIYESARQPKLL